MKEENNFLLYSSNDYQKESHEIKSKVSSNSDNDAGKNKSFWDCFQDIRASTTTTKMDINNSDNVDESLLLQELENYLSKPIIERKSLPLDWWKMNPTNFPILSKLVKKYLSSPASSVYSERLFSETGLIYEKKHNRILPKNAEQLLFLHHNLPILKNRNA